MTPGPRKPPVRGSCCRADDSRRAASGRAGTCLVTDANRRGEMNLSARWLLIALLVPALGTAACGDDDDEAAEEPAGGATALELRIGNLVPLTGDLSDFGPPGRKAADLAVEQVRAAADEGGADHTVEITHEDTQTQPQAAVSAA